MTELVQISASASLLQSKESTELLSGSGSFQSYLSSALHRFITGIKDSKLGDGETLNDVSLDDYDYIVDAISDVETHRYKLSYSPLSKTLTAMLPGDFHKSSTQYIHQAIFKALEKMEVPKSLGTFVLANNNNAHGALNCESMVEMLLGVPDVLVQFQDAIAVRSELWCVETSFSQPRDDAIWKLQRIADCSTLGVIAVTLIDIKETPPYSAPSDTSATARAFEHRTLAISQERWARACKARKSLSNSTSVIVYQHVWVSAITVTITTWLRQPDGKLDLNDYRAQYYAHGQLYPTRDECGLTNLQVVFQNTLLKIRDVIIHRLRMIPPSLLSDLDSDSDDSDAADLTDLSLADEVAEALPNIQAWVPSEPLMDWDEMLRFLRVAAVQTSFKRYSSWHAGFLRRQAEDREGTPIKRLRVDH